jgi:glycosyltransferase involved in cell wall biosynthesis
MISVCVPIYNGIEFIDESVSSVIAQTYDKWELIIGVNGHPQNSQIFQRAKQYESNRIKVLDLYTIKGKSSALNEMIKHCSYDYVAILDVDDIWHPEKLHIQSKFFNSYDVIGSNCVYFGDLQGIVPSIPQLDISAFDFKLVDPIINSSSITRKKLCYWDENIYSGVEDYDLWIRLRLQGCKFYNCPEILVKHRIHRESAFNSKGNHNAVPALLQKYYGN